MELDCDLCADGRSSRLIDAIPITSTRVPSSRSNRITELRNCGPRAHYLTEGASSASSTRSKNSVSVGCVAASVRPFRLQ